MVESQGFGSTSNEILSFALLLAIPVAYAQRPPINRASFHKICSHTSKKKAVWIRLKNVTLQEGNIEVAPQI